MTEGRTSTRLVKARPSADGTRDKILDAGEALFASAGFDGVSMRQIGTGANVPFASVAYHFESKLGLYRAIFARRGHEITTDRVAKLRGIQLGQDREANLLQIATVFVEALLRLREHEWGPTFARLLAREFNDPHEGDRGLVETYFDSTAHATIELLGKVAPEVSRARLNWAYFCAASPILALQADTGRLERVSGEQSRVADLDQGIEEITRFVAGGLVTALALE